MSLKGNATAGERLVGNINRCDTLLLSAYAIAVKNGFNGTEAEWLESLQGKDATEEQVKNAVETFMADNNNGLSDTASALLIAILRNGVYTSDQSANIAALETALGTSGSDSGGSEGGETEGGGSGTTHTHSYTASVTTAATCTGAGVRTYTCACGSSYTEPIPAAGHRYSDGICTVCGAADPDAGGETVTYTVTSTLTNVTTSNTAETVAEGAAYTAILMPDTGYVLGAVTVTMGGVDVTAEALSGRTISIAAVTGDLVITAAAETDTRTLLHHWDLTKSLTDTVGGAAITLNGATQDANGLTLGSATAYATLDEAVTNRKEVTIEVDFGDMSRTGTAHGRLLMATAANGFIYRNTGSWQIYMDAWSGDTLETDANAFANSTLVIKQSGDFSSSTSGTHYWTVEHNGKVIVEKARAAGYGLTLKLGSSSNSYYTAVIKAIRVYEGAA